MWQPPSPGETAPTHHEVSGQLSFSDAETELWEAWQRGEQFTLLVSDEDWERSPNRRRRQG